MLRVHLFGRPRLLLDEIQLPVGGRPKVFPLLAYVLLHRASAVPRAVVAGALWPDEPEDDARANLRRHLNYLGALLPQAEGDRPWVVARDNRVQWNPACEVWLDVAEFERLAAEPLRLRDAIALYVDDLLPDVDEDWLAPERERLKLRFREALSAHVASLRAARAYAPAIAAAQRLLAHDPWREDTLRTLLMLRYESGDRAGALADYERFARMLREELGTDPMPETVAVYASLLHDARPPPSPARADSATRAQAHGRDALPFVGRDAEMAALHERWDLAAAGSGGVVLVGGEAGVGKSRILGELGAACEAKGALVYTAATTVPEAVPYQPFTALLRFAAPLLANVPVDPLWLSALAPLVPGLADYAPDLPPLAAVEQGRERARLFEACANVWEAIATRRPVVLLVEDVHWAGAASLALLEHLARRAARARVLIVASYREDELELGHGLRDLRRRLERDGIAVHLALSRLSLDAVEAVLTSVAASDDARRLARMLHERSEGNPFVLEELLRDADEAGRLRIVGGRWTFDASSDALLPPAVRDALGARLERLDEAARTLAETAAVIGRGFDVELLRETTGWPESSVLDALSRLTDRRIVNERGPRGAFDYAFTHHLIAVVVYEAIPAATRVRRHRRVAHVMRALYAGSDDVAAELALHWERGGEPELAAEQHLIAARRARAVYANDEAARHATRAHELSASDRVRFEALLLRERLGAAAGARDTQARDLDELAQLARRLGDEDAICTVLERRLELADVVSDLRRERIVLALLERRVRRSADARWAARALEARARYLRATNDFAGAQATFRRLVALTELGEDRGALAKARLAIADTFIYEGRLAEAQRTLDELRAALDAAEHRGAMVRTLMAFARAALSRQDYAAMTSLAEEAYEISRAIGDLEGEALALHTLANGLVTTFRVREARTYYERAAELYERIDHRVGMASIAVDVGLFHTELGLLDRALDEYARARAIASEIDFRWVLCVERIDRAYALRLRGDATASRVEAAAALALAREIGSAPLESAALGTLGVAESALGLHDDAIAHLVRGVDLRRPAGATPRLGDNLRGLAEARLRAGDLAAAERAADEMLSLYDTDPSLPPQPAEWLCTAADVARASGRADDATQLLRGAVAVVHARAAAIDDAATRAAYLALPFNRAVVDARTTAAPRRRG